MERVEDLLKNYKNIISDINNYEWIIKTEENKSLDIPISRLSDMPHKTGYVENNVTAQIDNKLDKIKECKDKIKDLKLKIDTIHKLSDILKQRNKEIIILFYFNGYRLQDISDHFDREGRHREIISIQQAKKKSIELMQAELDKWISRC